MPGAPPTLSGSWEGNSFQVHDAIAFRPSLQGENVLVVAYTDAKNLCGHLQAGTQKASTQYVTVTLLADAGNAAAAPPIVPGTYTVGPTPQPQPDGSTLLVTGGFSALDAACHDNLVMNLAQSGTVTLSGVSATQVSGSFQFTFQNGDKFEGTFDVPVCALPPGAPASPSCVP
jgi:hypothetical protein